MAAPDAYLHAYVDGELSDEQFDRCATEILSSDEHFNRARDLLALKLLIRRAYQTLSVSGDA